MSTRFGDWVRSLFGPRTSERDTEADPHVARTRATGGDPERDDRDAGSTTGPGANETFVGRVAGNDDVGAVGETGAEARARPTNSDGRQA